MRVRIRPLAFAACAVLLTSFMMVAALMAADLYLHKRTERSAGLNVWGYRGPVAPKKRPGDIRVAVLGGSTVFGYGVTRDQAFPALLEQRLNGRVAGGRRFSVVNLGYNNEGAYSFRYTLEDYAYLDIDIVCLYEGYNDLMGDPNGANHSVYRRNSPIFRLTGYFPVFPLVFREKAMALLHGGNVNAAYAPDGKTVFHPTAANRATAAALETAATIGDSLERQLERVAKPAPGAGPRPQSGSCAYPWTDYCDSVAGAVDYALSHGQRVLVVTQPYPLWPKVEERHRSQQQALADMLHERFADRPAFRYVNLGDAVDLRDGTLSYDGMHLTPAGNARIADRLAGPVAEAAR